jgi:RNA polymerase sporulation-specific sigma factor
MASFGEGQLADRTLNLIKQSLSSSYRPMADNSVVRLAQGGDRRASEYLLYKYRGLVRTKIRSYFLLGAEKDDLLQIGMIGLWQAIMDYSPERDISFLSFARICIERHVITAIKAASRRKQSPLNNAVSLESCTEECCGDFNLAEVLVSHVEPDPEETLIRREDRKLLRMALRSLLSEFEWQVLKRYHLGKSYREIAVDLSCNAKSVDNALGRIKRKVAGMPASLFTT